jgi:peptidyl-prolyl cis-trans isomerase SurA
MKATTPLRSRSALLAAAAAALLIAAGQAMAQTVVAFVNGAPITAIDVEQRSKFLQLGGQKNVSRQEVLEQLIDEQLKLAEAKRWGLTVPDKEVEASFSLMASRMGRSGEQLTQSLAKSGVNASTLKARIKADLAWQQLVRGRYQARLQLSDREVDAALQEDTDDKEEAGYEYILRPVLFLVPPSSSPSVYESRRRDAEALRGRFKTCKEGLAMARAMHHVVVRDQMVRNSADLPPTLRKLLDSVPLGQLTAPEVTKHGVEMFAVCSKLASKSETPGKRKARDNIFAKRFEEESKRYLQQLRRAAMIERR